MKALILISLLAIGAITHADYAATENQQQCFTDARKALEKRFNVQDSAVSFFNGAMVGDGVDAIEIDIYLIKGKDGMYKVELDADGCDLRSVEYVNN